MKGGEELSELLQSLMAELKNKHNGELDLKNEHYYLFFKDGVFNVYLDEDEKELKVDVTFSDGIKIYFSTKGINEEFNALKEKPTDGNQ